jgi:hypothetical protein
MPPSYMKILGIVVGALSLLFLCCREQPQGPREPFANATPQEKAASAKKAWDAYIATPEGKAAEAQRKKAERDLAERSSPKGKARAEAEQFRRYEYSKKCENVFLDLGYDIRCVADENTLMVIGKPVNRVFVHQMSRLLDGKTLKSLGFKTLKFWNGSTFSSYDETFDVTH